MRLCVCVRDCMCMFVCTSVSMCESFCVSAWLVSFLHVKPFGVILCREVRELRTLQVYIYIFCAVISSNLLNLAKNWPCVVSCSIRVLSIYIECLNEPETNYPGFTLWIFRIKGLVWFGFFYFNGIQPLKVIWCRSHSCRRTVVVLFNL